MGGGWWLEASEVDDALGVVDCCVAAGGRERETERKRKREREREVNIVLIVPST